MPPRYSGANRSPGVFTIDDRSWAIFLAYTKENRTLDEVGRMYGLSAFRVRRIVRQVESEIGRAGPAEHARLQVDSAIEQLGLPMRTRNSLRAIGCETIGDLLRLDLSTPVRGLGAKSRETLLERLRVEGFSHPGAKEPPVSEIHLLERSLERIQRRVELALGSVSKEIAALKQRLNKKVGGPQPDPCGITGPGVDDRH